MSATAVLLCMASTADRALAQRAISSTAAELCSGDCIFVHVDGAETCDEKSFRAAGGAINTRFVYSRHRIGLAQGLNKLIDAALREQQWVYFARMDADDECLPGRFAAQREFLQKNPHIDIVGGLCHEVDPLGKHLRTKRLPLTHEQIVANLAKRNPLNHPTVMITRKVFASGLRYRSDVGLVEDWNLWIDACAAGFKFANLDRVVLKFRRSEDFFDKRGGFNQAIAEWNVRKYARRALKLNTSTNITYAAAASLVRLAPGRLQELAYRLAG